MGQQPKILGSEKNGPQNTQHGTRHKNDAKTISAQNLECRCQTLDWKRWQCPVQTSDCFHAQFETRPEPRPEPSLEPILSPGRAWFEPPWNSGCRGTPDETKLKTPTRNRVFPLVNRRIQKGTAQFLLPFEELLKSEFRVILSFDLRN